MKQIKILFLVLIVLTSCSNTKPNVNEDVSVDWKNEGIELHEIINFDNVKNVQLRNVNGPHHISMTTWQELKNNVMNAVGQNGLWCKPQTLAFIFEMKDGEKIEGYICGQTINFEQEGFSGTFKMREEINYHNY